MLKIGGKEREKKGNVDLLLMHESSRFLSYVLFIPVQNQAVCFSLFFCEFENKYKTIISLSFTHLLCLSDICTEFLWGINY